jgi:hypothetical protein
MAIFALLAAAALLVGATADEARAHVIVHKVRRYVRHELDLFDALLSISRSSCVV